MRPFPFVATAILAAVLATDTLGQSPAATEGWRQTLDATEELLANGSFTEARDRLSRLTRDMADEITTPGDADRLFAIALAQLAVAEAGSGDGEDAVWQWQIAQNIHEAGRAFDLSPYGTAAEALIANTLPAKPEKCSRPANAPAPAILRRSEPRYPKRARRIPVTGLVIVEIELDPEGRPIRPQVLRSPSAALTYSALIALREWRFETNRTAPFCRLFSFGQ